QVVGAPLQAKAGRLLDLDIFPVGKDDERTYAPATAFHRGTEGRQQTLGGNGVSRTEGGVAFVKRLLAWQPLVQLAARLGARVIRRPRDQIRNVGAERSPGFVDEPHRLASEPSRGDEQSVELLAQIRDPRALIGGPCQLGRLRGQAFGLRADLGYRPARAW